MRRTGKRGSQPQEIKVHKGGRREVEVVAGVVKTYSLGSSFRSAAETSKWKVGSPLGSGSLLRQVHALSTPRQEHGPSHLQCISRADRIRWTLRRLDGCWARRPVVASSVSLRARPCAAPRAGRGRAARVRPGVRPGVWPGVWRGWRAAAVGCRPKGSTRRGPARGRHGWPPR